MELIIGKALAILLVGNTHYIDIGKSEDAIMYYESETVAHMSLPDGPTFKGDLELRQEAYYVKWHGGPEGLWQLERFRINRPHILLPQSNWNILSL